MKTLGRVCCFLVAQLLLVVALPPVGAVFGANAGANPFPVYRSIQPNVAFWLDIYSKYTSSQGVLHDSQDLTVIYEVIPLENTWERGARRRNKKRIQSAKKKYREILRRLARGKQPLKAEEKRVRALFGPRAGGKTFQEAAGNIRLQVGQKDIFRDGVIRSGSYLATIKRIIKSYGLPEDLAYLPHVESSFNYKAYSKFGAAGIWQFTRATGKRFMTIDYTVDERRDPIRATHAAARLLKGNYEKLGNWPLAITAYNHGANGMLNAKGAMGGYEAIFKEYNGKRFKFASRNFYSEFLAAREVARNYQAHFGSLRLEPLLEGREVILPGFAPVKDLLRYFALDMDTFRRLNPALREPVFEGRKYVPKGHRLRLPLRKGLVRLAANMPETLFRPNQKRSSFYLVRRGDTAGSIARRHNITLRELLFANQLDSRATIYAGQNLRIPKKDQAIVQLADVSKQRAAERRLASLTPHLPLSAGDPEQALSPVSPERKVQAGEGGAPAQELSRETTAPPTEPELPASGRLAMSSAHERRESRPEAAEPLRPEQGGTATRLTLMAAHSKAKTAEARVMANPAVVLGHLKVERLVSGEDGRIGIIRVEAEETLGHYAEWLGVRARDLRRLNGFRFGQAIRIDQPIKIPLDKVGQEQFEEQRYEYHKEIEEDFFAAYQVEGTRKYRIKKGDNIWALCRTEFDLPLWLVKKYNDSLDFNNLKPNQDLLVPVVEKRG